MNPPSPFPLSKDGTFKDLWIDEMFHTAQSVINDPVLATLTRACHRFTDRTVCFVVSEFISTSGSIETVALPSLNSATLNFVCEPLTLLCVGFCLYAHLSPLISRTRL
jgi:hypothetical protein